MFFSRFHYENGNLHLSLDSLTGEIMEFCRKNGGDNLIKSAPWGKPNLFAIQTEWGVLTVPTPAQARVFPCLTPKITSAENGVCIEYSHLYGKNGVIEYGVKCVIETEGDTTCWSIETDNKKGAYTHFIRFPVLGGMWLGKDWRDDTLVYPYNAGIKIKSPVTALAKAPEKVYWRWQDYRYVYTMNGVCGYKDEEGMYTYGFPYSGPASMAWCDVYDQKEGIYLGMHEASGICAVKVASCGEDTPALYMFAEKTVESKESAVFENIVTAFHDGDWHDGADIYRKATQKEKTPVPLWWENSVALAAHYDFKYQCGGIVHTFSDMGDIAEQAEVIGCDHILCSGWHKGGFDNGFPLYIADEELGGKESLRKGIADIHARNKKVSFYINSRIGNLYYEDEKDMIRRNTVIKADGKAEEERYGNEELQFVTLCAASEEWQERLLDAIKYVVSLGADGVYLDQLGMAAPRMCHSKTHGHARADQWCAGYRRIIEEARNITTASGEKLNVIIEGISSLYGDIACGGLVSTFAYQHNHAFPELYRYTFPEHGMVDMLYPEKNLAMRPVHVAQASREMADRAYICGMYFWIYDLEYDNTFRRDEESLAYLNTLISARKEWINKHKGYMFADDKGISSVSNAKAKNFVKEQSGIIPYINQGNGVVTLDFKAEADCKYEFSGEKTIIYLPERTAGVICYKKVL